MPYRVLKETATSASGWILHPAGTVLSDGEVDPYVREKIAAQDPHYLSLFKPLSGEEATEHRTKETTQEGWHLVHGQWIAPPWPDYVGLHQEDVIARLRKSSEDEIAQTKTYERGGAARPAIVGFERDSAETSPESQGASTSPQALRWAASNPGDAQHVAELESRLAALEHRLSAVEQTHAAQKESA
jgi:hypothetical protein